MKVVIKEIINLIPRELIEGIKTIKIGINNEREIKILNKNFLSNWITKYLFPIR